MAYNYPRINNCLKYESLDEDYVEDADFLTDGGFCMGTDRSELAKKIDGETNLYNIETNRTEDEIDIFRHFENFGMPIIVAVSAITINIHLIRVMIFEEFFSDSFFLLTIIRYTY